jgi:hypothetical protein
MPNKPVNSRSATQRQTVQLEVPKGGNINDFFEKDPTGNISIKHDQLKDLLDKNALGPDNKLDMNAIKVSVGVDF